MKKLAKHLKHYLPLFGVLIIGGVGFVNFSYDKQFQAAIVISTALGYFVWGLIHHFLHRDLHIQVVLEYLAIAILGVVVVFSLLFGA